MKNIIWLAAALGLSITGCKDDSGLTGDDGPEPDAAVQPDAPPGVTVVRVAAGDIATDTTWTKNKIYVLEGYVFVTGGTLTIEPGTTIKGENGSALTITKDARINAVGTAAEPIVFTSAQTTPASGDWGGVVLLGKAPINVTGGTNPIEGFATSFGERIRYGGADATHNCGQLVYSRIEYAGFALAVDTELNGLTMGGCGNTTRIDYVQSHLGLDDGIEIFGGTVNVNHLVITQPDDDGLDWDFGWSGRAQFVIVQQKNGRGDKGFEADNNPNNNDASPRSAPEIWNATLIGGDSVFANKKQGGMHLRRGTAGRINNAIVAYFNQYGANLDGTATRAQFGTSLSIQNTYFVKATTQTAAWPTGFDVSGGNQDDCDPAPAPAGTNCFDEQGMIGNGATNHVDVDVQLGAPKDLVVPSFKPAAGSPVLTGCGVPSAGFDQSATFCGAVGTTDWTAGWTRFPG
jgi:hypothetical protein